MTFETIINTANARATALGKTLIFGDTAVQNVAANELSDDFFTLRRNHWKLYGHERT